MAMNQPNQKKSKYVNLGTLRNGIKIWKFQNQRSAVDITHMLNSYREKEKNDSKELLYSGRLCFSITSDGKYMKAYLPKSEAKLIFKMILNGTFSKNYPSGFKSYGGSIREGKVFANVFNIRPYKQKNSRTNADETKIEVSAQETPGSVTKTGGFTPNKGVKPTNEAKTILSVMDFLTMASECLDFINAAEVKGVQEGIPLHTITSYDYEKLPEGTNSSMGTPAGTQTTVQAPKEHTAEELKNFEAREFLEMYEKEKGKMKKYQDEYNRRVELKKQKDAQKANA